MRFKIHRAADGIGGNCIEVQEHGQSILLDLGLPLVAGKPDSRWLPNVEGLAEGDNANLLAILISHPHQDHYGLLGCAHPNIPVYLGERARRLLAAAEFSTPISKIPQSVTGYSDRRAFSIGPFTITAFAVDHSAFDSYALLIEAGGKRLLYSGDFRLHGEPELARALLDDPPADVDVLLMEGTVLGREDEGDERTEAGLEIDLAESMRYSSNLALCCFSGQNISRVTTVLRATRRAGRKLVVDAYTAQLLLACKGQGVPSLETDDLRVFLPKRQKRQIVRGQRFDLVNPLRERRVFLDRLAATPAQWTVLFRDSMRDDFASMDLKGGKLLYSLWPGYLNRDGGSLRKWAAAQGMSFEIHHTSGHAYIPDLKRFAEAIAPKVLIPIHTLQPSRYASISANTDVVPNSAWREV